MILVIIICGLTLFIGVPFFIQRYKFGRNLADSWIWLATVVGYAMLIGVISFSLGFFGPICFSPESNQGPLLGIFITGPVGVLIGASIGSYRGFKNNVT